MASVTCLLVLVCAVAVSAQPLYCSKPSKGHLQGPGVELVPVPLQPGYAVWNIKIPDIPQCDRGVVGVSAQVCDSDSIPDGYFLDFHNLVIHRTGQLQGFGSVKVTVYCHELYSPLLGAPENQYSLLNQDQSQTKTLVIKPY